MFDGAAADEIFERVEADAKSYAIGGFDGIIVENFGSWPFPKGNGEQPTPPWQIAWMTRAALVAKAASNLPIGINVLRNDARAALGIASAVGASFVRVNVHVGVSVTDQGLIEGRAFETMRVRSNLKLDHVGILADVRVKHARALVDRPLRAEVEELIHRGGADAVIVTGEGTGKSVDPELAIEVAEYAGNTPVYIGSGMSPEGAHLLSHVHGAIVGSWVKESGHVSNPVDPSRVRQLVSS